MKHASEQTTIGNIINNIDRHTDTPWHEVMGVTIPRLDEAIAAEDYDKANEIEADWLREHADDAVTVSWPEHVTVPRYNSDAYYQLA